RSFFPDVVVPTKEVSIEVQRGKEKVAVDVFRGTDGNRNQWTRSTEKLFLPTYFRENFDATRLQLYDRLYGSTEITDAVFAAYINDVADHQLELQETIERAIEIQCAQVLESGIILNAGTNTSIDYKRKAASLVDKGTGNYWATNTVNPFTDIEAGCNFLRQVGKAAGGTFNLILGSQALSDLISNEIFTTRQNLFHMALDMVAAPQRNAVGATLHGEITCGSYKVRLWAYPQFYDDANGVSTPYLDPKKVILIPEQPRFKTAFGAVPQLITPQAPPRVGAFIFTDFIDVDKRTHKFDIESCPLPIPTAVDTIYTLKVVAG
ncbi:MAG TPA: major capsid protein, partial [Bacteroidia bacterium]|nr:major capsid protein [Bacteroidia bacterium]